MKKCILTMFFLILFIGNALADGKFDGYGWNELSESSKAFFLAGFLFGHRIGEYEGLTEGYVMGQLETMMVIEKEKAVKIEDAFKEKMLNLTMDKVTKGEIAISRYSVPVPLKMIGELDAFYKTYPLCKSKEIDDMLTEFIKVWRSENKKTYKEIGEKCAEGN